ncbi:hypothetical protein ACH40E_42970 [Streptomyces acidicola]|uniref:hypothetical protein n=1 Tax=Streptomyces acidicola TaxID=2596892 RepID=UPI0037B10A60
MNLSDLVTEDVGSFAAGVSAALSLPVVAIVGAMQARAAHRNAEQAYKGAQKTAEATIRTAEATLQAALAGAREAGREQHAHWLREKRQSIWADYLLALDGIWIHEPSDMGSRVREVYRLEAMIEMLGPSTESEPDIVGLAADARRIVMSIAEGVHRKQQLHQIRQELANRIQNEDDPGGPFHRALQVVGDAISPPRDMDGGDDDCYELVDLLAEALTSCPPPVPDTFSDLAEWSEMVVNLPKLFLDWKYGELEEKRNAFAEMARHLTASSL